MLAREHLSARLARHYTSMEQAVTLYGELAITISPLATPPVSRDPDDDHVLACALAAHADAVVSGDGDLLSLGSHRGIPILTAAQAVGRIKRKT